MTGVRSTPRTSHGTRGSHALRVAHGTVAPVRLTAVVALALATIACESLLTGDSNTSGLPNFGVAGGGSSNVGNPVGPNGEPITPVGGPEDRNPSLGIVNNGPTTDPTGAPLPVAALPALTVCSTPGPRIIRRLTSTQYRNTLVSVFDSTDVPDAPVLTDPTTLGYNVDSDDALIEGLDAGALMTLAESVAEWAVQNRLGQLSNNCNNLNDQNCRQQFIRNLGELISREPVDQERVDRFNALFNGAASFQDGAFSVIAAMVQSPYLLYRRELGPLDRNQTEYVLTPFEVASELSYFLTDGPPDDALMQAAEQGRLASNTDIDREAARLLATPAADEVFARFVRAWTDIDRLRDKAKSGADLSPELRADMLQETEELFLDVLNRPDGTIGDLFAANYTYINQALSNFYGIQGASSGTFERVDISDGRRVPGLLGHGSYLAAHALADNSSPVQRAFVVRERFLCNDLPDVPTDLDTNLAAPVPTDTSRERYARHSSEQPCLGCHQLMDPIGFTFEHYDGFGRYRETEAGKPVDSSGGVPVMNGPNLADPPVTYPLANVEELAAYLSQIEEARACMINNLSYYAYGIANDAKWTPKRNGVSEKECTDDFIRGEARAAGNTLQSALMGIVHAPHFTRRVRDL